MKTKETLQSDPKGFVNDRATIIIKAHYQEFDPPMNTVATHSFDFVNDKADSSFQTTQKISPSKRVLLNLGHLADGSCMLVLSHDIPRISADSPDMLKEAMQRNIITLTNEAGAVVGLLRPRRASVVEYPFPVYAVSSEATALLSITAIPVHNEEIST